jgi:plasmid stabilization system protein ParE
MYIEYHPSVRQDVAEAMRRCRAVSDKLADDFKTDLRRVIAMVGTNPNRFHTVKPGFHRADLKRFPYHFIYRQTPDGIRVTRVRHHRQHPEGRMERQ